MEAINGKDNNLEATYEKMQLSSTEISDWCILDLLNLIFYLCTFFFFKSNLKDLNLYLIFGHFLFLNCIVVLN